MGNPSDRSQSFGLSLLGAAFSNWFGGALEHDYTPSHGFGGAEGLRDQAHLFFFRNGVGDVLVNFLTHEGEGAEGEDREACMDASGFRVSKGDSVGYKRGGYYCTEQQLQYRQRLNWFCGGLESTSETSSNRESFLNCR